MAVVGRVGEAVEFDTDFFKGPRRFEKKWMYVLKPGEVKAVKGRLIVEYSFWTGDVVLRIRVHEAGRDLYKSDVKIFSGPQLTQPFKKMSKTIDINIPVNTKVSEGVLELELVVETLTGSLAGKLINLEIETSQ